VLDQKPENILQVLMSIPVFNNMFWYCLAKTLKVLVQTETC